MEQGPAGFPQAGCDQQRCDGETPFPAEGQSAASSGEGGENPFRSQQWPGTRRGLYV